MAIYSGREGTVKTLSQVDIYLDTPSAPLNAELCPRLANRSGVARRQTAQDDGYGFAHARPN